MPSDFAYTELPAEERRQLAEKERGMHADILNCLEGGDGKGASAIVEDHVLDTVDYTRRALAESERYE
jgi:DNA-binding GntR family transcriptional regulator